MRPTLFFLVSAFCIIACKKSDVEVAYTGMFISNRMKVTSLPKMYTQNGEVTNQVVINQYLDNLQRGNTYFFKNNDTIIRSGNDSIQFITADTALIKRPNAWDKRIVKQQGDYTYLYMLDTVRFISSVGTSPFDAVVKKIGIYQPYLRVNCNSVNFCRTESYEAALVKWQGKGLVYPFMSFSLIHNDPNGSIYGVGRDNYNNVFDPSVVTLLKNKDTLLVQSFELMFDKVQ